MLLIVTVLLALDLANRGRVWQFFWSQTGEETPLAQARGMVEWAGNLIRPHPNPDPLIPVDHTGDMPYGINTFLQKEVEAAKVEAQLQMIADAGFGWIRQEFPWEDIEVDGRGQFTDSRNDMDGDGSIDTISGWDKYDRIVALAARHGLRIQARLSNPPAWAHASPEIGNFAPPDSVEDYVSYAVATAERYRGRITHYQIWNEPNIYPEWGEQAVDPEAYTEMLCRTYAALKAVDPSIVVISGALAPTSELSGRNLSDFVFLQRMYDAGASRCFDVLSIQGYGLFSGPTDRRMRPTTVNINRSLYIRDLMVRNGDAHKPIWISEAAWNFVPGEDTHPDPISLRYNFGQVTMEQAAAYMPEMYQRFREEFPWIGVINYWFFTQEDDSRRDQSLYYFRMVEPDYSAEKPSYTPLPIYDSVRSYITTTPPTLYPGTHQLDEHWAVYTVDAQTVPDAEAQFGSTLRAASVQFTAVGTDVALRWRGGTIQVTTVDGTATYDAANWRTVRLAGSTLSQRHSITITAGTALLDAVTVRNRAFANVLPLITGGTALAVLLALIGLEWRASRRN